MTSTNIKFARIALFTLSALFAVGSQAEETMSHDMSQMPGMNMGQQQQQQMYPLNGRVVTVDTANQQVTLEHDAVTELNWPAMTMSFALGANHDKKLAVGQKVDFTFRQTDSGYALVSMTAH